MTEWTTEEAIDFCRKLEAIVPEYGCHVALTGGCLYKDGPRKDLDILFYRIRQVDEIDLKCLFAALKGFGITLTSNHGWVQKAIYGNKNIDFFFPEYKPSFWDKVVDKFSVQTVSGY